MTIGTLAARIMADASGIKAGMGLARDELKITRQAFIDSASDADKLNTALAQLESAKGKGAFQNEEAYAAAIASVRAELDPTIKAQLETAAAVEKTQSALQEQINTFGLTAEEIQRYKLQQQGATAEDIAAVEAKQQQLAAMRAAQAEYDAEQQQLREVAAMVEAAKVAEVERVAATIDAAERIKVSLQEEMATRGMSADEIQLWKLRQDGATDATIASVAAVQRQAQELREQDAATAAAAAESNRLEQEVEQLSQALREEAATAGMSKDQIQIWRLQHRGASADSINLVRQLQAQRTAAQQATGSHTNLASGLQQVASGAGSAIPGVSGLTNTLQLGNPVLIAAAVAVGGVAIAYKTARAAVDWYTKGVAKGLEEIDKLSKEARTLGTSVQDLRELRFAAAEIAGMDANQFDRGLEKMTKAIGEANAGAKEQSEAFKALKLDARALSEMDTAAAFKQIADAMDGVANKNERARLATKLFGKDYADLVNLFMAGSATIDASGEAVRRYAGEISDVDAAAVEASNDAWGRVSMTIAGLTEKAAVELAPALQVAAERVLEIFDPQASSGQAIAMALEVVPPLLAKIIDLGDIAIGKFQQKQVEVMKLANVAVQAAATVDEAIALITPGYEASEDLQSWAADYQRQIDLASKEAQQRIDRGFAGGTAARMEQIAAEARKAVEEAAQNKTGNIFDEAIGQQQKLAGAAAGTAGAYKREAAAITDFADILDAPKVIDPFGDALAGVTAGLSQMGATGIEGFEDIMSWGEEATAVVDDVGESIKKLNQPTANNIAAMGLGEAFDIARQGIKPAIVDRFAGIGEPVPAGPEPVTLNIWTAIKEGIEALIRKEGIVVEEVTKA